MLFVRSRVRGGIRPGGGVLLEKGVNRLDETKLTRSERELITEFRKAGVVEILASDPDEPADEESSLDVEQQHKAPTAPEPEEVEAPRPRRPPKQRRAAQS